MVATAAALAERSWWTEWREIRCPVLIVVGESGAISTIHAKEMATEIERARVVCLPAAGHDVHLDTPDAWCEAVEAFL